MTKGTKRLYMISGEASGDLHGGNLIHALNQMTNGIEIRCWGGDRMKAAGGVVVKHIKELAFMGFIEVILNIRTILRNMRDCKQDILDFKPDVLLLIDYPGFNLRMAEWAKNNGIKVYYYISPQVWAWKQSRVHKIKRFVDHMFVILPFEKDFYKKFDYSVEYVGHPLLDELKNFKPSTQFLNELKYDAKRPIVLLLPGSRKQEVKIKLPLMLEAVKQLDGYRVIIAGAPTLDREFYRELVHEDMELYFGYTYDLLTVSEVALVTSGTATLETALLNVPQVVCYKGSSISYFIAKALIKIRFISLVNLIMDREVVKELIQDECNPDKIREELNKLLKGGVERKRMMENYSSLRALLGEGGASFQVARSLLKTL